MIAVNKHILMFIGAIFVLSACSGGGSESSNSDASIPVSTQFTFTVNDNYTDLSGNTNLARIFIDTLIQAAHASLGSQNINVVNVDEDGRITAVQTLLEGPTEVSEGRYQVKINEPGSPSTVIIVNPEAPLTVQVGQSLDPSAYLYIPAVDAEEILEINIASTLIYDRFLNAIDSFDRISNTEMDRILENASDRLKEKSLVASSREEMQALLITELETFVDTETKLALLTDESVIKEAVTTGSVEGDRAKIKAFFDDVNTLATLSVGLVDKNEQGSMEELYEKINTGQLVLQTSTESIEDLSEIQAIISDALSTIVKGDKLSIETLFSSHEKSQLSGTITDTDSEFNIEITGSYGTLSSVELAFLVRAQNTTNPVVISISGKVESDEALIELRNTAINIVADSVTDSSLDSDSYGEELAKKIEAASVSFDAKIVAKKILNNEDASFEGKIFAAGLRSSKDYIAFMGDDATPFYNIHNISLEGRFEFSGEYISAKLNGEQKNAAAFTPLTQNYIEGETYTDLVSYSFNGTDEFTLNARDSSLHLKATEHEYEILFEKGTPYNVATESYSSSSFKEWVSSQKFEISSNGEVFQVTGSELTPDTEDGIVYGLSDKSIDELLVRYEFNENSLVLTNYDNSNYFSNHYTLIDQSLDGEPSKVIEHEYSHAYAAIEFDNENNAHYFSSLEDLVENSKYPVQVLVKPDNYPYHIAYYVTLSNLELGTLNGTVRANKPNWESPEAPSFVEIPYEYTSNGYILNKGSQYYEVKYEVGKIYKNKGLKIEKSLTSKEFYSQKVLAVEHTILSPYYYAESDLKRYVADNYILESDFDYNESSWFKIEPIGKVRLDFDSTIESGKNIPVKATILSLNSLLRVENDDVYRAYKYDLELDTHLTGLGQTNVKSKFERTGYDDGVFTLTLSNIHANLKAEISVMVTAIDGELGTVVVGNSDGFAISEKDFTEHKDGFTVTYGKESARVQLVGTGIKVTYSNGQFDLY